MSTNEFSAASSPLFSEDFPASKEKISIPGVLIENPAAVISSSVSDLAVSKGNAFADEITEKFISDFEKTEAMRNSGITDEADKMVHVSTFLHIGGMIYMTYYANIDTAAEDPNFQRARLVYCPDNAPDQKTFLDIQAVGETCGRRRVNMVYDTILAQIDDDTLMVLWTAKVGDTYYRLYRKFSISTRTLGEVGVNRFRVGEIENDFSSSGIVSALTENGIGCKTMFSDIGIMQKFTCREEAGQRWYYTGTYSGDLNCIIKSRDFITWTYVAQPDFPNLSKWENAVYVLDDICYYFVRQHDETPYGFLTAYDLINQTWAQPVLVEDCQSRGDFIFYKGNLYLFHAPVDREHIGILKIDTADLSRSQVVLQAKMHTSCFYPFIQFYTDGELAMSYTVARRHIRLAKFTLSNYLD